MAERENWALSEGYCFLEDHEINVCKPKGKKEKVTKYQISDIVSMEKELKNDWVQIRFLTDGKTVKKELSFKTGGGEKFINAVVSQSSAEKFKESTKKISAYDAARRPLSIFFYLLLAIILILAANYAIDYGAALFNLQTVEVPVVLLVLMKIARFLGHKTCLIIIGTIGLLCLLGAIVRLVKRPEARFVEVNRANSL